jgi:hypothetical protein
MHRATVLASAAAGLLLLAGSPALAMSGQCFWERLEPPTRGALLDGYQRLGPEVLDRVPISDRELAAIDAACGPGPGALKERLLSAVVFEHGSAVFLKGWLRWDDMAIQAAWNRVGPQAAGALRRQAEDVLSGAPPAGEDAVTGAIGAFLGRDPAAQPPGLVDQVRGYLTSRAMREVIERASGQ